MFLGQSSLYLETVEVLHMILTCESIFGQIRKLDFLFFAKFIQLRRYRLQ